ncbi:MAG TPA: Hsp20/alpha crystallin family protein [Nitrospira sp.]|nr:Hsp20/alpha crystallin family protein [Nitrospira sp.]
MADMPIKKGDKDATAQKASEGGQHTTAMQRSGERGIRRRSTPSLFSLTPRDFFTASPFELMRRFTEDMDRFFEGAGPGWSTGSSLWSPPIEITEQDGHLMIAAELPGVKKEDVKVELSPEGLQISGERKREQEERRGGLYRSERSYGSFVRTIPIPDDARIEEATATFEDGVLKVSLPIPEATQRRREIPIEGGAGSGAQKAEATPKAA